jgi:hypothetical protein
MQLRIATSTFLKGNDLEGSRLLHAVSAPKRECSFWSLDSAERIGVLGGDQLDALRKQPYVDALALNQP